MGKNIVVGQSGGPTSVINSSLAGVFEGGKKYGAGKIYGMRHGIEGLIRDDLIDLSEKLDTPEKVRTLMHTPASYLGSCRYRLPDPMKNQAVFQQIFEVLRRRDIGCLLYIGGNDSMDTIMKLSDYGKMVGSSIRFIGVPKTIDNDLRITDHTPGYGSAARYIATCIKELVADTCIYDLKSVTVVEIMGRDAGWLTAAAALAKGPDCEGARMICLPEVPFDPERFVENVARMQNVTPSMVIAVSEGIRTQRGQYVCELTENNAAVDSFGHRYLGGTAHFLSSLLQSRLGTKTRAVELSTLQRCAAHLASSSDIDEAFMAGEEGAKAALSGETGMMVAFVRTSEKPYVCGPQLIDVHEVANKEKLIPVEWIDQENWQMKQPFFDYALPLIHGDDPAYSGLGKHLSL